MNKKWILILMIITLASGSLFAGGTDFQLGGGYNGIFLGSNKSDLKSYPLGFTAFGGLGYKFFPTLSIGAEYEFGKTWTFNDLGSGQSITMDEHIPKVYFKFNALNLLAVSALAGYDFQTMKADGNKVFREDSFTLGARVAFLFGYAQYMMIFNDDRVDSRISVGVTLSK